MSLTTPYKQRYNHQKAQRFSTWLGIISIAMAFGGWTSAYLVRKAAGGWMSFSLPSIFWVSTIVILLSSVTMQLAHVANKKGLTSLLKLFLFLTFGFGVAFFVLQLDGWHQLQSLGIYHDGNVAGSFFYVITWGHAAHIILGLLFVLIAFIRTFRAINKKDASHFYENDQDFYKIRTDILSPFWHFLDFLWVYLFIFLNLNH
ncbi:MAG: cytochrome c oxidase subunit 3 [Chitinophagales bacterium]|nr:cytochrome c oxidase subunit 3 [Chitinophagales bacterium]